MSDDPVEQLLNSGRRTNLQRDIRRQGEVERLLEDYDVEYVIEHFEYVMRKYGFSSEYLRKMAPACVERARNEREQRAAVGELWSKMVGAEEP